MYVGHRLLRTQFLPLFVQWRCPARSRKVWGHGAVSRSDGLWRIQGTVWRKPGAVRTLQPASFKHKNNTLRLCSQQLKTNFGRLNNYIRFYLWKRKIPPTQRSDDFVGWNGGKMNRVCCGAVEIKVLWSPLRPNVYKISYSKICPSSIWIIFLYTLLFPRELTLIGGVAL